mmetsp:Transcript_47603/g.149190  ORF Transcript_47603/g.149190 Transcript_47603/m.149190 type:complete len:208 (+) Transcript_47603:145-768(+)
MISLSLAARSLSYRCLFILFACRDGGTSSTNFTQSGGTSFPLLSSCHHRVTSCSRMSSCLSASPPAVRIDLSPRVDLSSLAPPVIALSILLGPLRFTSPSFGSTIRRSFPSASFLVSVSSSLFRSLATFLLLLKDVTGLCSSTHAQLSSCSPPATSTALIAPWVFWSSRNASDAVLALRSRFLLPARGGSDSFCSTSHICWSRAELP